MAARPSKIPHEHRQAFERAKLLVKAEYASLDGFYQAQLAEADWLEFLTTFERYCVERFRLTEFYLRAVALAPKPGELHPIYQRTLRRVQQILLSRAGVVLKSLRSDVRGQLLSRLELKLHAVALELSADAQSIAASRLEAKVPRKKVTLAIVNKRKRIVREFRRRYGLKAPDLARRAAISQTAILGIVNEDWLRFASDTQVRFLKLIGKSLDDLYTE